LFFAAPGVERIREFGTSSLKLLSRQFELVLGPSHLEQNTPAKRSISALGGQNQDSLLAAIDLSNLLVKLDAFRD
jgi:hypothetical protein